MYNYLISLFLHKHKRACYRKPTHQLRETEHGLHADSAPRSSGGV